MSKSDDRIIMKSSKDFAVAAMQLLDKTKVFHISQEELAAKLPDIVSWDDIKVTPLGLRKNNIHILQCADGITVSFYRHATRGRSGEISYERNISKKKLHFQVESIFSKHFSILV